MIRALQVMRRFVRLPLDEKVVVGEAAVILGATSAGLRVAPSRWTGRALRRANAEENSAQAAPSAAQVGRAVERVARHLPHATCLAQALTGWVMLTRRRQSARVALGVRRADGAIGAHAWLESGGQIVLGAEKAGQHVVFPGSE